MSKLKLKPGENQHQSLITMGMGRRMGQMGAMGRLWFTFKYDFSYRSRDSFDLIGLISK